MGAQPVKLTVLPQSRSKRFCKAVFGTLGNISLLGAFILRVDCLDPIIIPRGAITVSSSMSMSTDLCAFPQARSVPSTLNSMPSRLQPPEPDGMRVDV